VVWPSFDIATLEFELQVPIHLCGMTEYMVAKFVARRVALSSSRVAFMKQDARYI